MEGGKQTGKLYSFSAGFLFAAIVLAVIFTGFNFARAAWSEPTQPPPAGNIAPPLNTGAVEQSKLGRLTLNGGLTTSELCFIGDGCQSSWDDVLGVWSQGVNGIFYDGGNVGVGPAFSGVTDWPLSWSRLFINLGSNREGLYISRDAATNYSYLNIENETGSPVFRVHQSGRIGIGLTEPNSDLHIYNTTKNAEINIQSTAGANEQWAIYHDGPNGQGTDELRFWKDGGNKTRIADTGTVTAADFCLESGSCLSDGGVGGYVGSTAGAYNGNQGGYAAANAICATEFSGSHVCGAEEIINTINSGAALPATIVWVINGPPGFTANANDCFGRTSSASGSNYGAIWLPPSVQYPQGVGALSQCSSTYKLSCCQ